MSDRSGIITAVPWVLSIITIAIGIWQYGDKQSQANKEPFLRKQLDYMFTASETVATLATTTDLETWKSKRNDFWRLYWGPLAIVEDPDVEGAMVAAGKIIPRPGIEPPQLPMADLEASSLTLSHEIRDLVLDSWNIDLPPLSESKG